jgi:hypothetical protein
MVTLWDLPSDLLDLIFRAAHRLQSNDTWLPQIRERRRHNLLDDLYWELGEATAVLRILD